MRTLIFIGLVCGLSPSISSAGPFVQHVAQFGSGEDILVDGGSYTRTYSLNLDPFDPTHGTLSSVQLRFDAVSRWIYGQFQSCDQQPFCNTFEPVITSLSYSIAGVAFGDATAAGGLGCAGAFGDPCVIPLSDLAIQDSQNRLFLPTAQFQGTDPVTFQIITTLDGPASGEYTRVDVGVTDLTLAYTFFDPVPAIPLPAGVLLLASGLGAFGLRRLIGQRVALGQRN